MYSYQPEGWLDSHTVPAPDAHTHTHMHTCPCTAHPIPPLRGHDKVVPVFKEVPCYKYVSLT